MGAAAASSALLDCGPGGGGLLGKGDVFGTEDVPADAVVGAGDGVAEPRNKYPSVTPSTRQNVAMTYAWVHVGRDSAVSCFAMCFGMPLSCD